MRPLTRTLSLAFFLTFLLFAGSRSASAQACRVCQPTNDPLVDEQDYLFDVHNLEEAWTYTTGSSNVKIGVYSMLGFIQNHQDLSGSRVLAPQGHAVEPALDYASEMVGITGADTDNGVGMAGIDRAAQFQSYSLLRQGFNPDADAQKEIALPGGGTVRFHFNQGDYAGLLNAGRSNGVDVHLFSYGTPTTNPYGDIDINQPEFPIDHTNPPRPDPLDGSFWDDVKDEIRSTLKDFFIDYFTEGFDFSSGDLDPLVAFNDAIGRAVKAGGVVVAPNGDQEDNVPAALRYLPAGKDRYVLSVGGLEYNADNDLVAWDSARATPYVDVAGFASGVVGFSGADPAEYNDSFGGTAAGAAIGAGVASLIEGEHPSLTGEDIDKVLELTARDADQPGRDDLTGAGAIDAGAALQFLQNNDIQREKEAVVNIISDQEVTGDVVALNGLGYEDNYLPDGVCLGPYPKYANGKLHRFEARVEFAETFSDPPEAWVRWARSDGLVSENRRDEDIITKLHTYYNPFRKRLKVVSVDERGILVEGHYWGDVEWHTTLRTCAIDRTIPNNAPGSFKVAYTAIGTEGPPPPLPLEVNLSTTGSPTSGESMTFTADVSQGEGGDPYTYRWDYDPDVDTPPAYPQQVRTHTSSSSTDSYSRTVDVPVGQTFGVKVAVEKGVQNGSTQASVQVLEECAPGETGEECDCPDGEICQNSLADTSGTEDALKGRQQGVSSANASPTARLPDGRVLIGGAGVSVDSLRAVARRVEAGELVVIGRRPEAGEQTGQQTNESTLPSAFALNGSYPNPARQKAHVNFDLPEPTDVEVALYDALGRVVRRIERSAVPAGREREVAFDLAGLSSGVYLYRLTAGDATGTGKIVVVK